MIEVALANAAVGFLVTKVAEGAVQTIGSDIYKIAIDKLKGFLTYKLAGKPELNEIQSNPERLISLIKEEASKDTAFKNELENLVKTLQQLSGKENDAGTSYTNVDSVTNFDINSVSESNVGGRDIIADNQISGGQISVGGDQRGSSFH